MAQVISIEELEAIINRVRRVAPPVNGILSPALRALAEIYGTMIYERARWLDIDELAEEKKITVCTWLNESKQQASG